MEVAYAAGNIGHTGPVNKVSCHPSGHYLLSASDDATLKIYDLLEGRPLYTLQGHTGPVTAAAFSSSGDQFASGGNDEQVFLWRTNFDVELNGSREKEHTGQQTKPREQELNRRMKSPKKSVPHMADPNSLVINKDTLLDECVPTTTEGCTVLTALPASSIECHHSARPHGSHSIPGHVPLASMNNISRDVQLSKPAGKHTDLECQNIPPVLSTALEHILSQLDILTQTVSLMEQRLTLMENRIKPDSS